LTGSLWFDQEVGKYLFEKK